MIEELTGFFRKVMKPLLTPLICLSLASGSLAQTTVTLDGASGSQTFNVPRTTLGGLTLGLGFQVEYLVIGGGGAGGGAFDNGPGGGGGAGGMLGGSLFLTNESVNVTVGTGGTAALASSGGNGGNSVFASITANGGGGGGGRGVNGLDGASGGGAGGRPVSSANRIGGTAIAGQGNAGGDNVWSGGGGGGGGAGGPGGSTVSDSGGAGGAGLASSISGTAITYSVGGTGGSDTAISNGVAGTVNRGNGGSGAAANASDTDRTGGVGGSGIVIARYKGASAGTGGTITSGTGTADGYTLHTFTATGASALDLSSLNLNTRLGAVENGVISGSGDLTFTGPGTLTLNASNIYTGTTRVNAGTLALGNAGSIAASAGIRIAQGARFDVSGLSGGFSLGASQTLAGSGTVAGNTTIASGGTLAPGNSPGVLTIEGATTFNNGSMFEWELDTAQSDPETNRGIAYDGVNTTSVSGSGANFKIMLTGTQDFTDGFWSQTRVWTDIFKSADGTTALSDWASVFSGGFQYEYNGKTVAPNSSGYFALSGDSLIWSAVPEPGHALALAGLLAASVLLRRRA